MFNLKLNKYFILLTIPTTIIINSCGKNFPVIEDLSKDKFLLVNQDSNAVIFPENFKNKIIVIGYIFTNCPDICPLTTNNMRLIQEKLSKEMISDVQLISISFDPLQDSPAVLKDYATIRNLNLKNWDFLTGEKSTIDSLTKKVGVVVIKSDSTMFDDGRKIYYYVHTDRIQLIDKEGRIRKNYIGSKINIDEIINDIKKLE
ncbi:MAG: SCO family protein [Melioribacter sp.]|nr:SCO family protein [Melioribacter sp.]